MLGDFAERYAFPRQKLVDHGPNGVRGGAFALAILYLLRLQNPSGRVPRFN